MGDIRDKFSASLISQVPLRNILLKNENIAASMIASNAKAMQKAIEKINDAYRNMD